MRRLIINPNTASAWEIPLPTGIHALGREAGNDLVIDHPSVSSRHGELMVMDSGVTIKDLGSANGTFIDGQPISESALLPGQLLQLGEVRAQLEQSIATPTATTSASSPATGPAHCKYHPRSPARYQCPQCHLHFCELCINTRATASQTRHTCRTCAVECTPVTATEIRDDITDLPFTRQMIGAFKYPLKGDGMILIALGTIFFLILDGASALARFAPLFGWGAVGMLTVFGMGYLFAYLRSILNASALGDDVMPGWPEMSGISTVFYEFLGTVLFCFGPALGITIYAAFQGGDGDTAWLGWATISAIFLGCIYFPMAFMAVAMFDSIGGVNPLLVIPSITKVLKEYVLTVVMLAVIVVLRWLLKNHLGAILPIPLLPTLISSLLGLYLLIVEMRILGLLYRNKKYELGWFT